MLSITTDDKKVLIFSLIAGTSANAALSGVTLQEIPFSVFPLLSCVLAFYCMLQQYKTRAIEGDVPLLTAASFIVGALAYAVGIRVLLPEIGSNFLPLMLCMALVFWMLNKVGLFSVSKSPD